MLLFVAISISSSYAEIPISYYNEKILSSSLENEELKEELFLTLSATQKSYSYREARVLLFNQIDLEFSSKEYYLEDVYCLKKYSRGVSRPDQELPDHNIINTEHTWPQSKFSSQFSKNTQKTDLHHLFPTFSRINSERGNLPFADVSDDRELFCEESRLGQPIAVGVGSYFEPPIEHKGNVARAMFYFSVRYRLPIDSVQEYYLRKWHQEDQVDEEEKKRNDRIFTHQKNRNPFIDFPHLVEKIGDF